MFVNVPSYLIPLHDGNFRADVKFNTRKTIRWLLMCDERTQVWEMASISTVVVFPGIALKRKFDTKFSHRPGSEM